MENTDTNTITTQAGDNGTAAMSDTGASAPDQKKQERTFTQAELDAIIQKRITEVKQKADQQSSATTDDQKAELDERERELARRELMFNAKEQVVAKGFSVDLLDALNISSPEALDKSLSIINAEFVKRNNAPLDLKGAVPASLPSYDTGDAFEAGTRQAMGLL